MAQVNRLERISLERNSVHRPVSMAAYTVIQHDDGKRYFQINTYGSADRELPGKISQSLQFSEEAVSQLLAILQSEFGPQDP